MSRSPIDCQIVSDRELQATQIERGLLPVAIPSKRPLLAGGEPYNQLLGAFSSSLEAFQRTFLTISSDDPSRPEAGRQFYLTAIIPGVKEKIPVFGMRETKTTEVGRNGKVIVTIEVFMFFGQDRIQAGKAIITLNENSKTIVEDFHLFSEDGNHVLMSGTMVNGMIQAYDNQGNPVHSFHAKKKKKKGTFVYEVRELNAAQKLRGGVKVSYAKNGWKGKKLKEVQIVFTNLEDFVAKPQMVMSTFMLLYQLRVI
eukprot:augustus_masked-scaffold_6-processed-gene-11.12-mRNA-1 protein AED:1.00 eAED:1.00 QI:0/-1/0/0/-1/1/1/0/254